MNYLNSLLMLAKDYVVSYFPEPEPTPSEPPIPWFIWLGIVLAIVLVGTGITLAVLLIKKRAAKKHDS